MSAEAHTQSGSGMFRRTDSLNYCLSNLRRSILRDSQKATNYGLVPETVAHARRQLVQLTLDFVRSRTIDTYLNSPHVAYSELMFNNVNVAEVGGDVHCS